MDAARTIHTLSARGRANVRDGDLARLADQHPDLIAVFEEVQFLRDLTDAQAARLNLLERA